MPSLSHLIINIRGATVEDISHITKRPKKDVKSAIDKLCFTGNEYSHYYYISEDDYSDVLELRFVDFLKHTIIVSRSKEQTTVFELSLFGILLAFIFITRTYPQKLFYSGLSVHSYTDKIVATYQDKLPQVFRKWEIFKQHLPWTLPYDVVQIFNPKINNMPITADENIKQIYQNLSSMQYYNRNEIMKFHKVGNELYKELIHEMVGLNQNISERKKSAKKEEAIGHILKLLMQEIYASFKFLSPIQFQQEIFQQIHADMKLQHNNISDRLTPIVVIEKALEDELTIMFYLYLLSSESKYVYYLGTNFIPLFEEFKMRIKSGIELSFTLMDWAELFSKIYVPTFEKLKRMVQSDLDIHNFVITIMNDARKYNKLSYENLVSLNENLEETKIIG